MVYYQKAINEQYEVNKQSLSNEIGTSQMQKKINNFAEKFGFEPKDVEKEILTNKMFSSFFVKDPIKQNIYEKVASEYLSNNELIIDFVNLPSSTKLFVVDGNIVSDRVDGIKSIDFIFNTSKSKFYCSHKFIKDSGGAQDNQYNDIIAFLTNALLYSNDDNVNFLAICDGPYFDKKMEYLISKYTNNKVHVCTINNINELIKKIDKI